MTSLSSPHHRRVVIILQNPTTGSITRNRTETISSILLFLLCDFSATSERNGNYASGTLVSCSLLEILTFLTCFGVLLSTRILTAIDSPW